MELQYKYAESTIKPLAIEVFDNIVFIRKDISKITRTSTGDNNVDYWGYQEAVISHKEFNEYTSLLIAENAINGKNDSDNIIRLLATQENSDVNQLTIMEAIAELYDMISLIIPG